MHKYEQQAKLNAIKIGDFFLYYMLISYTAHQQGTEE